MLVKYMQLHSCMLMLTKQMRSARCDLNMGGLTFRVVWADMYVWREWSTDTPITLKTSMLTLLYVQYFLPL